MRVTTFDDQADKTIGGGLATRGYQQITDLSSSVSLTVPSGSILAIIQVEAQDARWRDDGTDPTSTVGMLMAVGETFVYTGELDEKEFIEQTAGAILNVSYY